MKRLMLLLALVACHEKQELTAPPPPLRPEAEPAPDAKTLQKDCEKTSPQEELKPLTFDERSIPEGLKLAQAANAKLRTSTSAEVDKPTREDYMSQAVDDFIKALKADPYDVPATYGLAAAYARIGRKQCTLNLLARLLQMRPHPSKHAEVEAAMDKLLGRNQPLDPDFSQLRGDDGFRKLIMKMCEGTNDANCVYGGQRDNRER